MKDEDFHGIAAGLEDAIAFAKGDSTRGTVHFAIDIKAIRKAAGKTQNQFAAAYHLPIGTVRDWEQGRRTPDAPAKALLAAIARDPVVVERLLSEPA